MDRRVPFAYGEWYHCYNRGIDKRKVFQDEYDANRFLMALYLANGTEPVHLFNTHKPKLDKSFKENRGSPIVAVGAYCLMPNHFHLLLKEITDGGITSFMRKVGTAYTMYFNAKNERVGNLFTKPFRSRRVGSDRYFQHVLQYIHCNPAELYESGWKSGRVRSMRVLERKLISYPYSSFESYTGNGTVSPILSRDGFDVANQLPVTRMLEEAREYYAEIAEDGFER
ncbi:MAG: transposase [bacterium]|nr:transposase [bacterium]